MTIDTTKRAVRSLMGCDWYQLLHRSYYSYYRLVSSIRGHLLYRFVRYTDFALVDGVIARAVYSISNLGSRVLEIPMSMPEQDVDFSLAFDTFTLHCLLSYLITISVTISISFFRVGYHGHGHQYKLTIDAYLMRGNPISISSQTSDNSLPFVPEYILYVIIKLHVLSSPFS